MGTADGTLIICIKEDIRVSNAYKGTIVSDNPWFIIKLIVKRRKYDVLISVLISHINVKKHLQNLFMIPFLWYHFYDEKDNVSMA